MVSFPDLLFSRLKCRLLRIFTKQLKLPRRSRPRLDYKVDPTRWRSIEKFIWTANGYGQKFIGPIRIFKQNPTWNPRDESNFLPISVLPIQKLCCDPGIAFINRHIYTNDTWHIMHMGIIETLWWQSFFPKVSE